MVSFKMDLLTNITKKKQKASVQIKSESSECQQSGLTRSEFKRAGFPGQGDKKMASEVEPEKSVAAACRGRSWIVQVFTRHKGTEVRKFEKHWQTSYRRHSLE